jgi:hypothetical protein
MRQKKVRSDDPESARSELICSCTFSVGATFASDSMTPVVIKDLFTFSKASLSWIPSPPFSSGFCLVLSLAQLPDLCIPVASPWGLEAQLRWELQVRCSEARLVGQSLGHQIDQC